MAGARLTFEVLRWSTGLWLLWRLPGLGPADGGGGGGKTVDVIVPARDEAAVLPALLESLRAQVRRPDRLIVVDDGSTDGTGEVGRAGGAEVIDPGAPPDGWAGKPWACSSGALASRADVVVFLDADTRPAPDALDRLVADHARRGGLVSVQPYHVTERAYERLSAFANLVAMMGVDAFGALGDRVPATGAFGPCLACSRADYVMVGGHAADPAAVLDDVALARRFRAAGLPVTCLAGRDQISFRMYPGGVGQLVDGWTRTMATGASTTRPATLVLVVVWLSGCITAAVAPFVAGGAGLVLYGAYAAQLAWQLRRVGRFGVVTALAFPVPLAFFLAVFVRSVVAARVRGRVRWRGRNLSTRVR